MRTRGPCSIKVSGAPDGYTWSCGCGRTSDATFATVAAAEEDALRHLDEDG